MGMVDMTPFPLPYLRFGLAVELRQRIQARDTLCAAFPIDDPRWTLPYAERLVYEGVLASILKGESLDDLQCRLQRERDTWSLLNCARDRSGTLTLDVYEFVKWQVYQDILLYVGLRLSGWSRDGKAVRT